VTRPRLIAAGLATLATLACEDTDAKYRAALKAASDSLDEAVKTCTPVPKESLSALEIGLTGAGGRKPIGYLSYGFAVTDRATGLTYVSAAVSAADASAIYVMTWASTTPQLGGGVIFSVTHGASVISVFPDSTARYHPDAHSVAAVASQKCVAQRTGVKTGA